MARRSDYLMQSLFYPVAKDFQPACWQPPADVYRMSNGWLIKFELAGVRPSELELSVSGNHLILRGKRRDIVVEEGQRSYSMEICYSEFQKTIAFSCDLERLDMATDYRDGMLLVRFAAKGGADEQR